MLACLSGIVVPTGWVVAGSIALALMLSVLLAGIFGPMPHYRITGAAAPPPNDSEDFLAILESLTDAKVNRTGRFDVLTNGPEFYPAALAAIAAAQHSVCLEAYIFQKCNIGRKYLDALVERQRAGVQVNITLDAFGSAGATRAFFRPLTDAGGKLRKYNRPTWDRLLHLDNRTHRELLVVDGTVGFIGGAGVGDHWWTGVHGHPRWRDTMVRVEGEAVTNLMATFAANWLCAAGELLIGPAYFPAVPCEQPTAALVINSTPTNGGSTRARVLFQLLLASAQRSISITTPYFLPDKGLMDELCRAVKKGVKVRILVPGKKSDHLLTRSTSRGGYGPLLKAGAEIFEYEAAMIHAKILVVDSLWTVVGSTNFDNRSFGINDEVNLAMRDPAIAARMEKDNAADLALSERVSLEAWQRRPLLQRAPELLGWIFERQQ